MRPEREILHVVDDPQITRLIAAQLEPHGYSVMSMNDPTDALGELVRGIRRVVLLDIEMPGTNGLELLRQIKEHDDGIQVIMLSGKMVSVLQSVDDGAEVCFFKPLDNIELMLDALDDAFQKLDHC